MNALLGATTTVAELDRLRSEVEGLRVQLDRTKQYLDTERANAKQAMFVISERMEHEAREHDFCDEFDIAVREINKALPAGFPKLSERIREWTVTTTYTIEVVQHVDARSEEEAREEAESEFDSSTFDFSDVVFHEEDQTIECRSQS